MMRHSAAEILVLKALAWAARGEALPGFLDQSGLDAGILHRRADDPELLGAFLDFLLADDRLVGAFCAEEGVTPASLHRARRALPGATPEG